jgi:hypothetical protein
VVENKLHNFLEVVSECVRVLSIWQHLLLFSGLHGLALKLGKGLELHFRDRRHVGLELRLVGRLGHDAKECYISCFSLIPSTYLILFYSLSKK